jgi:protein HOOK3
MESYKSQIAELESKGSAKTKETDAVKFELDQTRTRLRILEEERAKDGEALELYQERVKELELTAPRVPRKVSGPQRTASEDESGVIQELVDGLDDEGMGLGGELDDALTGTTTTDLKLQIRKLKRDLEAAQANQNQAEASRVLVLENLLDDARRMKSRYEADYLSEHREKLVLTKELDEIRSGKSLGDGQVKLSFPIQLVSNKAHE